MCEVKDVKDVEDGEDGGSGEEKIQINIDKSHRIRVIEVIYQNYYWE